MPLLSSPLPHLTPPVLPPMPPLKAPVDKIKKPRHRHSAVQLAALNGLFEQNEHPSLAQRTELAQSLGLETKSVNAYFQNKRASSKKQPRGSPYDAPSRPTHPTPYSTIDDDYYYPPTPNDGVVLNQSQASHLDQERSRNQYSAPDQRQFLSESDVVGGDTESRPERLQIEELQRIYRLNPYPTTEETRAISERIAMRHQIITEWFRTQRSLDRRNMADGYPGGSIITPVAEASERRPRVYPTLPPISTLPPASSHPSLIGIDSVRRIVAIPEDPYYAPSRTRRSSSPRNTAPYGASTALSLSARQRRGRPDAFQLNSLRRLLSKTPTPSIEERAALAREIGMDLGKVTNWFRNLRQSARKRERKAGRRAGSDDEYGYGYGEPVYLSSTSRSRSESPDEREGENEYGRGRRRGEHSSDEEEEAQEAVTPASSSSPSPGPPPSRRRPPDEKPTTQFSVPYEDALLLLGFHRHAGMF
ncbi:homeodomain transcription factor [Mycena maculata]|uniref:Homeodomain transcription factor n=1 Tax=Mycena maculata TaxID=230809 RepID=A0AAD7MRU2_9AGAR|nr:homeodomain transcription factor [Mycena maculata]